MGEEERLNDLQNKIGAVERRIEYISDPAFLDQFSMDVRSEYEAEVRELESILNGYVFEVRDIVNEVIGSKVNELNDILGQFNTGVITTRVEAFIEEVGGRDASIAEVLGGLANRLDVEELNQVIDIYNRVNNARNQIASAISRARAIPASIPGIPDMSKIIGKIIKKILSGIKGGLNVITLEFTEIREDWVGPQKIKDTLSELYGGIVKS